MPKNTVNETKIIAFGIFSIAQNTVGNKMRNNVKF